MSYIIKRMAGEPMYYTGKRKAGNCYFFWCMDIANAKRYRFRHHAEKQMCFWSKGDHFATYAIEEVK
jgi:hypothetical protein